MAHDSAFNRPRWRILSLALAMPSITRLTRSTGMYPRAGSSMTPRHVDDAQSWTSHAGSDRFPASPRINPTNDWAAYSSPAGDAASIVVPSPEIARRYSLPTSCCASKPAGFRISTIGESSGGTLAFLTMRPISCSMSSCNRAAATSLSSVSAGTMVSDSSIDRWASSIVRVCGRGRSCVSVILRTSSFPGSDCHALKFR